MTTHKFVKILSGITLLTSLACADTYTGLDVKNGKGIKGEQLKTENLIGNIKIDNLDVSEIIVKAKGSDDYLRNLIIEQDGDTLLIKHKDKDSPALKDTIDTDIHIQLPRHARLDLGLTNAHATIADRGGETIVTINGSGSANLEGVEGTFKSAINGNGNVELEKLNGDAETTIQGAGKVNIQSGKSSLIKTNISGSGDVSFGGEVGNADLTISGSGKVFINRLTGSIDQKISGHGQVEIKSKA